MLVANIFEVKAKLSEFLDAVANGERVIICKRNRPVAELRAVEGVRTAPRPIGVGREAFTVPDSFFEPLPEDVIGEFYETEDRTPRGKVAERPLEPYRTDDTVKGGGRKS